MRMEPDWFLFLSWDPSGTGVKYFYNMVATHLKYPGHSKFFEIKKNLKMKTDIIHIFLNLRWLKTV